MFDKRIGSVLYKYYNKVFGESDTDDLTPQYRLNDICQVRPSARSIMTAEGEMETFQAPVR